MSINTIQIETKKQQIKKDLLKKGIQPNNYEINQRLTNFFETKTLGFPYYAPIKQNPYDVSSKEAYNHNFQTLQEDIDNIYAANVKANNRAVAMQEYYDTEKNKVINALTKLALRIDNIENIINNSNSGEQYVQNFDDLYGIDFYGNAQRNIPYTTSFIDLLQRKVYTEKTNSNINKLNLSKAKISINMLNFTETIKQGELTNVLNDTIDSTYTLLLQSDTKDTKTIDIIIDLQSIVTFNTVMFSFSSSKAMGCLLSLSEDGENYLPVYEFYHSNLIEWNFPKRSSRYIKITCLKQECDGTTIKNQIEYKDFYYILKNISIAMEEFENKSILVTKPITFKNLINSIELNVKDMLFNGTRVDYFIGFDNETNKIGWDKIENHKEYQIPLFEKKEKIVNYSILGFSENDNLADQLYQIYPLPATANRNNVKVVAGYNMWSVKRYTLQEDQKSQETNFDFNHFDFTEYVDHCIEDTLFMDCENYDHFSLNPNVMYVFTQYVELTEENSVYNKFIRVVNSSFMPIYKINQEKCYQKVFINGTEITPVDNWFYSFNLKSGINKIQIAIFSTSLTSLTTSDNILYHNLNFKELTNNVYAFQPMKFVNWSILQYQMKENYSYYTIKDNKILVKANPNAMIKSEINDMGYFISYYDLTPNMANYFKASQVSFRIMAVLTSANQDLSPEIINMQITGK